MKTVIIVVVCTAIAGGTVIAWGVWYTRPRPVPPAVAMPTTPTASDSPVLQDRVAAVANMTTADRHEAEAVVPKSPTPVAPAPLGAPPARPKEPQKDPETSLEADTIWVGTLYLKNGSTFEGEITDAGDKYGVNLGSGSMWFEKSRVARVEGGPVRARPKVGRDSASHEGAGDSAHLDALEREFDEQRANAGEETKRVMNEARAIVQGRSLDASVQRYLSATPAVQSCVDSQPYLVETARQSGLLDRINDGIHAQRRASVAAAEKAADDAAYQRLAAADEEWMHEQVAILKPRQAEALVNNFSRAVGIVTTGDPEQALRAYNSAPAAVQRLIFERPSLTDVAQRSGLLRAIQESSR